MASVSASEAAKAINKIIQLDCEDQELLLDIIGNYFYSPNEYPDSDDSGSNSDDDMNGGQGE